MQQVLIVFLSSFLLISCSKQIMSTDFTKEGSFTTGAEGPAMDTEGSLYAVNYEEQGTIGKVTRNGESEIFVKLPNGSIGNGIRFGTKNQMFVADYVNHNILEIDLIDKQVKIFAHEPTANQPNDLAIAPDKTLYASDPNWSDDTGKLWKVTREKGFELLEDKMGTTNGIEVSPDGKKLYVNESVQKKIWVYDIIEGGYVNNKREFTSFKDFGLDGMRCDDEGNLYVCRYGKGSVVKLSPTGKVLKEIKIKGNNITNITFSNDYKKAYLTISDRGCIVVIEI